MSVRDRMRIAITNDDGVAAPGIRALAEAAVVAGHEVVVVAPRTNFSGAGCSTGVDLGDRPAISVAPYEMGGIPAYQVDGTPAVCALLCANAALGERPDVLLSGINLGANLGTHVLHSGTVGAALTAFNCGLSSLAVSLEVREIPTREDWRIAAEVAMSVVAGLPGPDVVVGNLNIPVALDGPERRVETTRLNTASGYYAARPVRARSTGGHDQVVLHRDSAHEHAPGTDSWAIARGRASLTWLTPVGCQMSRSPLATSS